VSQRVLHSVLGFALLLAACGTDDPPLQDGNQNVGDGDGESDDGDGDADNGEGDGDADRNGDGDAGDGDTGDGDTGDGDAGDGDASLGPGPTIPKASMACPSLKSGKTTIMDLETTIIAGTPSKDNSGPLLLYWHGTGSSPTEVLGTLPASVRNEITAQGGMIVAPHDPASGTARGTQAEDVTGAGVWFTTHDWAFADLIVACAVESYGIDPRRIYTTGCSAGGLMAGRTEIQHGSYLAATSTNSGGLTTKYGMTAGDYVSPAMVMFGDVSKDKVEIDGLGTYTFETPAKNLSDIVRGAGGFVISCKHDGDHCGAPAELQAAAWQFMKDHPFGTTSSPYAKSGLPKSFPSYCQIVK
jgi:hypothetical protein